MPTALNIKDLLLAPKLDFHQVTALLAPYGFREIKRADANLQMIADDPAARTLFAEILEECLSCFAQTAAPDQALNYFERFSQATFSKTSFLSYLRAAPKAIWLLANVFGSSPFLSETLLRNPEYLYWVFDPDVFKREKKKKALSRELTQALRLIKEKEHQKEFLRTFKRKEILRIGVRDLFREASVEETLRALSDLADVLIQKAHALCELELRRRYGRPFYRPSGRGSIKKARSGFTILAMGKLGGRELNFSSDVDIIYLYTSSHGETSGGRGKEILSNSAYFERLSQEVTAALSAMTSEGYIYRVDLRLRPEGDKGLIANSLDGYRRYYASRGETWERLSLLKVRPVAGDLRLGRAFQKMVEPFIFRRPFGRPGRAEIKKVKERIDERIAAAGQTQAHVKLGTGGIREIEFIVQSIQIESGGSDPTVRELNTLKAIRKLFWARRLPPNTCRDLSEAYRFLRDVENKLQMVHDQQTHLLPSDPNDLRACAMRLGYQDKGEVPALEPLLTDYRYHTGRVHDIFESFFSPSGAEKNRP